MPKSKVEIDRPITASPISCLLRLDSTPGQIVEALRELAVLLKTGKITAADIREQLGHLGQPEAEADSIDHAATKIANAVLIAFITASDSTPVQRAEALVALTFQVQRGKLTAAQIAEQLGQADQTKIETAVSSVLATTK